MINKNIKNENGKEEIICSMISEDGSETLQAEVTYRFKQVKKGKFAIVTFRDDFKINSDYDCAYSMLINTIPEGIYSVVIGNKPNDKNYSIIKEAAIRAGFTETRGKLIKFL